MQAKVQKSKHYLKKDISISLSNEAPNGICSTQLGTAPYKTHVRSQNHLMLTKEGDENSRVAICPPLFRLAKFSELKQGIMFTTSNC